jgi:hypothetical protein
MQAVAECLARPSESVFKYDALAPVFFLGQTGAVSKRRAGICAGPDVSAAMTTMAEVAATPTEVQPERGTVPIPIVAVVVIGGVPVPAIAAMQVTIMPPAATIVDSVES